MGWQTFYKLDASTYQLLNYLDTGICMVFLADWFQKLFSAQSKTAFLKWGWIDLLCSIPFTQALWIQYHTVIRLFRSFRAVKYIHDYFHADKGTSKFADCCIIGIAFIAFAAIGVFNCEKGVEGANIKNLSDSLWWAAATVTTIGYGDRFPVTDIGRFIASFVMIGGVGLYASFTGFIVSKFINDERVDHLVKENAEIKDMLQQLINKKDLD